VEKGRPSNARPINFGYDSRGIRVQVWDRAVGGTQGKRKEQAKEQKGYVGKQGGERFELRKNTAYLKQQQRSDSKEGRGRVESGNLQLHEGRARRRKGLQPLRQKNCRQEKIRELRGREVERPSPLVEKKKTKHYPQGKKKPDRTYGGKIKARQDIRSKPIMRATARKKKGKGN